MPTVPSAAAEPSQDVPIFLRKTYHMINTCNADIACWSDDGDTFVIKNPDKFEQVIIPQFFKHSKFSSFVRQLNFYSFRKLKYADTLRIDPKLEAESANYWKFRHENFRRGKPELLNRIKRMNGHKSTAKAPAKATVTKTTLESGSNSEVQSLKKKIEEMTKNIDELTAMVHKVSLVQDEQLCKSEVVPESVGSKRKKTDVTEASTEMDSHASTVAPETAISLGFDDIVMPVSSMAMDALSNLPELPMPMPMDTEDKISSQSTDAEFVDQLFDAFADEGDQLLDLDLPEQVDEKQQQQDQPDPILMKRLGEALMLLPRDVQEMIVDKLIAAITSTDLVTSTKLTDLKPNTKQVKPSSPVSQLKAVESAAKEEKVVSMPLAAATLAALLRHYNIEVDEKKPKNLQKSIPVIPVHA